MTHDPYQLAGHIRRALYDITEHYDAAADPPTIRDDSDNRGGDLARPPTNLHAIDVRRETEAALHYWCRYILEHVNDGTITTHVRNDVASRAAFVNTWALALAEQHTSDAHTCRDELTKNARQLNAVAHGTRTRSIEVGPCPEAIFIIEGELETLTRCDGTVVAVLTERDPDNEEDGLLPHHLTCTTRPDHTWQPWQWADIGKRIERMGA